MELSGMCNLAETYIKLHDYDHAREILSDVCQSLEKIPAEYKKILILADLSILYSTIDPQKARKCLEQGIKRLNKVEIDKNPMASKRIVLAIVQMNLIEPDSRLIDTAMQISSKITEPVDYVDSLIAVFSMTKNDRDRGKTIITCMSEAVEKIPSPYEKASALLDIIPLALQNSDDDTPAILLRKAEVLTRRINIPQIADTIRDKIAQMYDVLYHKHNNNEYLHSAKEVAKTIENDDIRLHRLTQMGLERHVRSTCSV